MYIFVKNVSEGCGFNSTGTGLPHSFFPPCTGGKGWSRVGVVQMLLYYVQLFIIKTHLETF